MTDSAKAPMSSKVDEYLEPEHRVFARLIALGASPAEAYAQMRKAAGLRAHTHQTNKKNGTALAESKLIQIRVKELMEAADKQAVLDAAWCRTEMAAIAMLAKERDDIPNAIKALEIVGKAYRAFEPDIYTPDDAERLTTPEVDAKPAEDPAAELDEDFKRIWDEVRGPGGNGFGHA